MTTTRVFGPQVQKPILLAVDNSAENSSKSNQSRTLDDIRKDATEKMFGGRSPIQDGKREDTPERSADGMLVIIYNLV